MIENIKPYIMKDLINKLQYDANINTLQYLVSKQIFCKYSGALLDYRDAILIEILRKGEESSRVIDGRYTHKLEEIKSKLLEAGCDKVSIFNNSKSKP